MSEKVRITIPEDGEVVTSNAPRTTAPVTFADDYVRHNLCVQAQFFGKNLERRRIGHKIARAFEGKRPGDVVELEPELAADLWIAASEVDYSGPHSAQLPESWLYAIPEFPASSDTERPASPSAAVEKQETAPS